MNNSYAADAAGGVCCFSHRGVRGLTAGRDKDRSIIGHRSIGHALYRNFCRQSEAAAIGYRADMSFGILSQYYPGPFKEQPPRSKRKSGRHGASAGFLMSELHYCRQRIYQVAATMNGP